MKRNNYIFLVLAIGIFIFYFFKLPKSFVLSEYFPLNEGDKYVYIHHEGIEEGVVTITVKNVKYTNRGKQYDFFWQGKYNDRTQTQILTPRGIILDSNRHLVGDIPLKVVRSYYPNNLMIPSVLSKNISFTMMQYMHDYDGNLVDKEEIWSRISFIGSERVSVGAGNFNCLHFSIIHSYKDQFGDSRHMHTYNFWISKGVGIVKSIHGFISFIGKSEIFPPEKNIMTRYNNSFVEVLELDKAFIGSNVIGK